MRPPQAAPSLRRRPQGSPSGTGELKGEGLRSCPWDGAILGHTPDAHHNNLLINDLLFPMSPPCDPSTTPGPPPKQTGCSELTAESFVTERKSYNLLLTEPRRVSLRNRGKIAFQCCVGFCHTATRTSLESARPVPFEPPPASHLGAATELS